MNDLELRPALPAEHTPINPQNISQQHEHLLQNILSRIFIACNVLKLSTETRFTSMVLFHRYAFHYFHNNGTNVDSTKILNTRKEVNKKGDASIQNGTINTILIHNREHLGNVAPICIFLGCKANNETRRIRDVINIAHKLGFSQIDPREKVEGIINVYETSSPPKLDETYWNKKQDIVTMEQSVLRVLQFDVHVCNPHRALLVIVDKLLPDGTVEESRHTCNRDVIQKAWTLLNDVSFHASALMLPLLELVCGVLVLAVGCSQCSHILGYNVTTASCSCEEYRLKHNWWSLRIGIGDLELQNAVKILRSVIPSL